MAAPVVSPFTAFGVGNGLPTCFGKLNVSVYDAYNPMTLGDLCKLYWMLWGIEGEASGLNGGVTSEVLEVNLDDDHNSGPTDYEPEDRRCNTTTVVAYDSDADGTNSDAAMWLYAKRGMTRMYDGVTTDEGNFIGYGITQPIAILNGFAEVGFGDTISTSLELRSYGDDFADGDEIWTVFDTTVSGIPFVARVNAYANGATKVIVEADPSISVTSGTSTVTSRIDDLEFYTTS